MKLLSGFVILFCCLNNLRTTTGDAAVETVEPSSLDVEKKISLVDIHEDCYQPREIGRCFAIFHRYAFNAEKLKCEEFIYGGCMGNKNNFESLDECERTCLKKETKTVSETSETDISSSTENSNFETTESL